MKLLTAPQRASFLSLARYDQDHLLCVCSKLRSAGYSDPDLLVAGMLHDIGKCEGKLHVRFVDRITKVVLTRVAPGLLKHLARPPARGWRGGLVLAVHHPELGAERAMDLGCNDRTCWLIQHHEDIDAHDPGPLKALQDADRVC